MRHESLPDELLSYLCVDSFLETMVDGRALKTAMEFGLIDRLASKPVPSEELIPQGASRSSFRLLLQLLTANKVVRESAGAVELTDEFCRALRFRDILEVKLDFGLASALDFAERFSDWLSDFNEFQANSRLFRQFDYRRSLESRPENFQHTRNWMRFTTALTRYETPVLMHLQSFSECRRPLDIGGNSGELMAQVCRANPEIQATVCDLPLVCDIGQQRIGQLGLSDRVQFFRANALDDSLPRGHDLIVFKSVLHDWPEQDAIRLLTRAFECLEPGGRLVIFERGPIRVSDRGVPFSLLPILLFFPCYRSSTIYSECLQHLGAENIRIDEVVLETDFFVLTAHKPK